MKYKFKLGELVRVQPNDIGLVTARQYVFTPSGPWAEYTILIGGILTTAQEFELTKVNK